MDYRDPDWLAEKLGIEKNTVYRFLQDGTIPAAQIGRKWLISEARVAEWLAAETDRQTRQRRDAARSTDVSVRRMDTFTADARDALRRAHSEARAQSHEELDQLHLLLGLSQDGKSAGGRALRALAITPQTISRAAEQLPRGESPPARRLGRNHAAKRALKLAARMALRET